ncbi:hypothetical protein BMW22_17725 [Rhizobium leguminosarum]|uniref:Uncharacterized protein n=1 Tax=Rhizobium leguminosarum TaxID=384 RepID=A0A1L3ZBY6_RHILE|nr:hypothetical protein BMW22_17725 [Rhizobium leguminosarum]
MERYLFTESNGLRRKFFQLDNFRNFPSKISLIRKYSHKKDRNFVAFGIKARPSRHAADIFPVFLMPRRCLQKQKPRLLGATAVQKFILVF